MKAILRMTAVALALAATAAAAQPGYGYGYGPMMGGGQGRGMMGGYGPMMGGGYGQGGLAALNLSDEQRQKVLAIQEEDRRANWAKMDEMHGEMFKLRSLYYSDKADAKAIVEQQAKVDDLRRKMLASRLESRKKIEQVLTPEQRKQLRSFGPWWLSDEE